jgi:SHS2 domain-containing protein
MFTRPEYNELEHTADVGMELTAGSLTEAFEQAAAAMFDLICDLDGVDTRVRRVVVVRARKNDLENMMVRWLGELLFLFGSERLVFSRFDIRSLTDETLEAHIEGEVFDPSRHTIRADIKAVTYHELAVEQRGDRWCVRVIFDT